MKQQLHHRVQHHLRNAFVPHEGNNYRPHALRHHWLGIYAGIIIAVKIFAVSFVTLYAGPVAPSDVTAANIIRLTNSARKNNGVATLRSNALLAKAAQSKANDMIRRQYFAHISPSGVSPWYFFKQAKYTYRYAGENLALDFTQSEDVIRAWLNSSSHRRNLLATKYQDIGVAVVRGKIDGLESIIVVQMFGTPLPQRTAAASKSQPQSPTVTAAKKQVATVKPAVPPRVLGETSTTTPVAPPTPVLITPGAASLVQTSRPEFVGTAEVGSEVSIMIDNQLAAIGTTASNGSFSIIPQVPIADGAHQIALQAKARGLTSPMTVAQGITVDTLPPQVQEAGSYVLPSLTKADTFDAVVQTTDDAREVAVHYGTSTAMLLPESGVYRGQISLGAHDVPGAVLLSVKDAAGNVTAMALTDPNLVTTGVVEPHDSSLATALRVLFFSRSFLLIFLVLMSILAFFNLVIHWQRQHHPTVIGTLIVLYLAVSLLFV